MSVHRPRLRGPRNETFRIGADNWRFSFAYTSCASHDCHLRPITCFGRSHARRTANQITLSHQRTQAEPLYAVYIRWPTSQCRGKQAHAKLKILRFRPLCVVCSVIVQRCHRATPTPPEGDQHGRRVTDAQPAFQGAGDPQCSRGESARTRPVTAAPRGRAPPARTRQLTR
jgi:hypothetical protein